MWKIVLTAEQASELGGLRAETRLRPIERSRVEMVALAAAGWSVERIATHLGCHPETVRRLFRRFRASGWAAVRQEPPGPEPDRVRQAAVESALADLLGQARTWTGRQLTAALAERGIVLSARHVRRYLGRLRAGWRRTKRDLGHRRDGERVAAAARELADLANGRERAR